MLFLNYPQNQAPKVNYPTGDYRTISRLDRNRAEEVKNSRLEAELAREKAWQDILFQKKLEELQKSLAAGGGVGGSVSMGSYGGGGGGGGIGAMGQGGGGGGIRWDERIRGRGASDEAIQNAKDQQYLMEQSILGSSRAGDLWQTANPFRLMTYGSKPPAAPFFNLLQGLNPYGMSRGR